MAMQLARLDCRALAVLRGVRQFLKRNVQPSVMRAPPLGFLTTTRALAADATNAPEGADEDAPRRQRGGMRRSLFAEGGPAAEDRAEAAEPGSRSRSRQELVQLHQQTLKDAGIELVGATKLHSACVSDGCEYGLCYTAGRAWTKRAEQGVARTTKPAAGGPSRTAIHALPAPGQLLHTVRYKGHHAPHPLLPRHAHRAVVRQQQPHACRTSRPRRTPPRFRARGCSPSGSPSSRAAPRAARGRPCCGS